MEIQCLDVYLLEAPEGETRMYNRLLEDLN